MDYQPTSSSSSSSSDEDLLRMMSLSSSSSDDEELIIIAAAAHMINRNNIIMNEIMSHISSEEEDEKFRSEVLPVLLTGSEAMKEMATNLPRENQGDPEPDQINAHSRHVKASRRLDCVEAVMDQQGQGQPPAMGVVTSGAQMPYGANPYQPNQMMGDTSSPIGTTVGSIPAPGPPMNYSATSATLAQHHLAYQQIQHQQQQQLQQQLRTFWENQYNEIEQTVDFKNHSLPLARIKKIMKADEDVRMIAAEAPVIFARACEMFILELTLRSWNHTEENKRRTLQKNDIAAAITRTDIFDFLVDIVPREDLKDEVLASMPRGPLPVGGPGETHPYYYIPQHSPQVGTPGMIMGKPVIDQGMYGQQPRPYMPPQMWPQPTMQQQEQQQQQDQDSDS